MFFNFTFRHFLTKPQSLAEQLQNTSMRGFANRILLVFILGILLFGARNWWGMGTESLTSILTMGTTADFTIARFTSLLGSVSWALIYMSFHFFGFAYILSLITAIPFKKLLPLQLLMTGLLLIEKALVFLIFVMKGEVANVSFLSFGPLAVTFIDIPYLIFFLNQITITTVIIIAFQYRFIQRFTGSTKTKQLVFILIGIHIAMALITAGVGFIPMESLFERYIEGGVGNV